MSSSAFDVFFILAAVVLISRVFVPWGERTTGNIVRRQRLSLLGRLRMQGQAALAIFIVAVVALVLGWINPVTLLSVSAVLMLLLTMPITYLLTSRGIRAGWTPFRRWTEFGGVVRRPGGVRLQGVAGARPLDLWLSGDVDDDDFVLLLRQLVRGSYKGHVGPETGVAAPDPVQTSPVGMAQNGVS